MTQRARRVGYALAFLLVLGSASAFLNSPLARVCLAIAGFAGWLAAIWVWSSLTRGLRLMATVLVLLGLTAGFVAGVTWQSLVERALSQNVGILCMLLAVGFLRLISLDHPSDRPARGPDGWWQTVFATALFGAVINITALLLIADYSRARGGGNAFTVQSLTRVFTASAAWSPFFAGMAVVLAYVPGASVTQLMAAALPYALTAMLLTWGYGRFFRTDELDSFVGFPLQPRALALPSVLAVLVVCAFVLMPDLSVVIAIALSALLTCFVFLLWQRGLVDTGRVMQRYVETSMASGKNELVLFLAAGVLAVGLGALFNSGLWSVPEFTYNWRAASAALAAMLCLAVVGVHPIVSVAGLAPVLLTLSPPPLLIALTFLFAWSLGTSISPMSATLLTVQARYGFASWRVALANAPFACAMYCIAVGCFFLVEAFVVETV
ncbi:MAG: hypothetical protein AAF499_04005 [Pseudomonadota bacterium]